VDDESAALELLVGTAAGSEEEIVGEGIVGKGEDNGAKDDETVDWETLSDLDMDQWQIQG
jgi:hypothetical protein